MGFMSLLRRGSGRRRNQGTPIRRDAITHADGHGFTCARFPSSASPSVKPETGN